MTSRITVGVVGLGYVGVPLVNLAARKGYQVIGIDVDEAKIAGLKSGKYEDPELHIPPKHLKKSVNIGTDFSLINKADIIIICVPTPVSKSFSPDLRPVKSACKGIARYLKKGQLVILESTVNPGVTRTVLLPILSKRSGLEPGRDFFVAHCPERINPGDKKWHIGNIPRVIGGLDRQSLERATDFYSSILSAPLKPMNHLEEAEAVKIVENSFRDINIAFVNELALSFTRLGIDVVEVIEGASTKPFGFMPHYPGMGVGGHCIPVDPYYLIEKAKANGFHHDFLALARRINNDMPTFLYERLEEAMNQHLMTVNGTDIALLGLSYKPGIGDTRHSPTWPLLDKLKKAGAKLRIFDPYVLDGSTTKSLKQTLDGAPVLVVATAHREFNKLNFKELKKRGLKIVIDGRNFFDKDKVTKAGLTYVGIGR